MTSLATFGKSFCGLSPAKQVRPTKFVHGHLPIGTRRYKQARIKDEKLKVCPCCKLHEETETHLLRCSKNPAQASSLRDLARCIHGGDTHAVKYLITGAIRHWSTYDDPYNSVISKYPSHLHSLITSALDSQAKIGWEQMMKGFLSTTWRTLASKDMFVEKPTNDDRQGESMIKTIMKGLAEHFSRLWEARNKVLHDTKDEEMRDVRSMEIAEIKYYFSRPHLLVFDDRHYCEGSLSKLLNGRSSNRRRWLRRVKTSIEIQKVPGSRQTQITSYFSPT